MRLADFILENVEAILVEWERFAASLTPGSAMGVIALRDHAEEILRVAARDMLSAQTEEQQEEKSKGRGGGGEESEFLDHASREHAVERLASGFNLTEVVSEYRALRASVLRLWRESRPDPDHRDLEDLTRFNESIDQSLGQAVKSYARGVDESREMFVATLGHDLRSPLHAIMLSASLLERSGQLDEQNRKVAAQIREFGDVMTGLIHDLLDFTRTRLGAGIPVSVEPVDAEDVCCQVLEQFRATHPDRVLAFDSDGKTKGEWDSARLRQVVSNLTANAIDHGDERAPVAISARGEGNELVLTVSNHGSPIPTHALTTIFEPYARGASSQSSRAEMSGGIGLGLYIAREIVHAHRGTISVESSKETGTTFTVRLPRRQEA